MNLALFLTGGYDTVALALSYCLYTMAFLVDEQKKLVAEIEGIFPFNSNVMMMQLFKKTCLFNKLYFSLNQMLTALNGLFI